MAGESLDLPEGFHRGNEAVGGDAFALLVAAVGVAVVWVEGEMTRPGVGPGLEGSVHVRGERSGPGVEVELVDGVRPGVGDEDGGAGGIENDGVCVLVGREKLGRFH